MNVNLIRNYLLYFVFGAIVIITGPHSVHSTVIGPTCNGIPASDGTVCNGFGECVAEDTCVCEDGFSGVWCENAPSDYGDAPDPTFPTLIANNGASHYLGSGLCLGAGVDSEPDGQPTATALGDDNADTDDDDGVAFTSFITKGQNMSLTVTASDNGLLDAWIDFNADGGWDGFGEQIFSSQALAAGDNEFTVAVPGDAVSGDTFARFRISTAGGLSYDGLANDGEVEDYSIEIHEFSSRPAPLSPIGEIADSTPTFTWNEVAGCYQYRLRVMGYRMGVLINNVYDATVFCDGGTCSVSPGVEMYGKCKWKVKGDKIGGGRPWSPWTSFEQTAEPGPGDAAL